MKALLVCLSALIALAAPCAAAFAAGAQPEGGDFRGHAVRFAEHWVTSWNSHDVDAITAEYASDFACTTPLIRRTLGVQSDTASGKPAARAYFKAVLEKYPDLEVTIIDVTSGAGSVAIYWRATTGGKEQKGIDTFFFNSRGQAFRVITTYSH